MKNVYFRFTFTSTGEKNKKMSERKKYYAPDYFSIAGSTHIAYSIILLWITFLHVPAYPTEIINYFRTAEIIHLWHWTIFNDQLNHLITSICDYIVSSRDSLIARRFGLFSSSLKWLWRQHTTFCCHFTEYVVNEDRSQSSAEFIHIWTGWETEGIQFISPKALRWKREMW